MGRPTNFSQDAWAQIERRLVGGAGVRSLAREFAIDSAAISRRFPQQSQQLRAIARRLADVQNDVAALPVHQQHLVVQLAVELRRITGEPIGTARAGPATAQRLSERAYRQVQKIDHCAPLTETSLASLESASELTRCSNEAASIDLTMLKLFKAPARVVEAAAKADERMVTRIKIAAMQPSTSGARADG